MKHSEREELIKQRLTPEFLETLKELGKVVGWQTDYCEIRAFIEKAYEMAGFNEPTMEELEPYETDDN